VRAVLSERVGGTVEWRGRHGVLVLAFLAALSTNLVRVVLSPLLPAITETFGVTTGTIGLALTGMWAAVALTQLPSGLLADRFGERPVVLASLGLTTVGGGLLALTPSFLAFAVVVGLLGAGVGLYYPAGTALLTRRFEDTGGALGVHAAAGPAGGLLAPLVATALSSRYDWRAGVAAGAVVALATLALLARGIGPTPALRPDERLRDRVDLAVFGALLARPRIAYTTVIAVATGYTWQAFVSFFPLFLVQYHGLSPGRAGLFFGAIFAASVVGLPVVGRLSDTFGRDAILALVLCLVAVGFTLFLTVDGSGLLVGVVVTASGMNWGGVLHSRYMDALGSDERGTGFGLVRTVSVLLGAAGNVVTGTVAQFAGWPVAYGVVVVLLLAVVGSLVANRALGVGL
jgi:YNFM family putative membrane transporter